MRLNQGELLHIYEVKHVDLPLNTERRLQALGLTNGTKVTITNKKRHGALIMKLRGTRFALGKSIAGNIEIEEAYNHEG